MTRGHRRLLLVLGAIFDLKYTLTHLDTFKREWSL